MSGDHLTHTVRSEVPVVRTPRVMQVEAMFDVPPSERSEQTWEVSLPLGERDWSIGLIVGPSGSGKTTVARSLWPDAIVDGFDWPEDRSVVDGFPENMGIGEITGLLSSVGFSSAPAWLRPFRALSNGEQFRVTMARALAESTGLVVVDEFTSVVDRQVAKVAAHTVQKAVRRQGRQFVALSCHFDIIEWLAPDWVYEPATGEFRWERLQRPRITLDIYPVVGRDFWPLFSKHHYLSADLHQGSRCWVAFVDGTPVAFTSVINIPHPSPKARNIRMGHRLVVLPDWQGLGIAARLEEWLGEHLYERGYRYRNTVTHPAMIRYYQRSPRWRQLPGPGISRPSRNPSLRARHLKVRHLQVRSLNKRSFEYAPKRRERT